MIVARCDMCWRGPGVSVHRVLLPDEAPRTFRCLFACARCVERFT